MWRPYLVLVPVTPSGTAERVLLPLPIQVCERHRGRGLMTSVLSTAGVRVVEEALGDLELPDVMWDRSRVRFIAIEGDVAASPRPRRSTTRR